MGRKLAVMAIGAVLAMGAFGTSSASAANAYSCNFTNGLAGNISPGVGLLLGGGSYTFSGNNATCTINGTVVNGVTITSSGTFTNVICGTGLVDGNATVSAPGFASFTANYTIVFNATVGELVIHKINGVATVPVEPGVSGAGIVQITPKTGSCTDAVTEFTVTGAFAAATA